MRRARCARIAMSGNRYAHSASASQQASTPRSEPAARALRRAFPCPPPIAQMRLPEGPTRATERGLNGPPSPDPRAQCAQAYHRNSARPRGARLHSRERTRAPVEARPGTPRARACARACPAPSRRSGGGPQVDHRPFPAAPLPRASLLPRPEPTDVRGTNFAPFRSDATSARVRAHARVPAAAARRRGRGHGRRPGAGAAQWNVVAMPSGVKSAEATMGASSVRGSWRPAMIALRRSFCCLCCLQPTTSPPVTEQGTGR